MWETAFDESMLNTHCKLIIRCQREDLALDLMEILDRSGIMWAAGCRPISYTRWGGYAENSCYLVESKTLFYVERRYVEHSSYAKDRRYVRCTFYGEDISDFATASDDELLSFLGGKAIINRRNEDNV